LREAVEDKFHKERHFLQGDTMPRKKFDPVDAVFDLAEEALKSKHPMMWFRSFLKIILTGLALLLVLGGCAVFALSALLRK
jgi:hypothetical protein